MSLTNLQPAAGSTHSKKRVGRGQGSGWGKTAARGQNGQKSRTGYKEKRGFEGGQQPLQKRLPKIGFTTRRVKAFTLNTDKNKKVAELAEITLASLVEAGIISNACTKVKLVGSKAKELASKIKDENITHSGK